MKTYGHILGNLALLIFTFQEVVALITYFTLFDIAGLLGVLFYIGSYGALQLGRLNGNSLLYTGLNGTAAAFVLISLYKDFNLASLLIQFCWISVSVVGATRLLMSTRQSEKSLKGKSKSYDII